MRHLQLRVRFILRAMRRKGLFESVLKANFFARNLADELVHSTLTVVLKRKKPVYLESGQSTRFAENSPSYTHFLELITESLLDARDSFSTVVLSEHRQRTEVVVKNDPVVGGNRLLARLPKALYARLFSKFKPVELAVGKVLYEARSAVEFAFFPTSGTLSSVVVMLDGSMIEVATVGNEGAVGLPTATTPEVSPHRVFCQVAGQGLRIEVESLEKEARQDGALKDVLVAYHTAFLAQVSQSVACNGLHQLYQRCCRWLLMTHDRVDGDEFKLTHELLAAMLGVRRPSVTEACKRCKTTA